MEYRKLIAVTKRDTYPISGIDEGIDSLSKATVFFTLDANSSFRKADVKKTDRDTTVFTSHHELFRFLQVPLSLKNALETFQRAIDVILLPFKWQYALAPLRKIVIFIRSSWDHIEHVNNYCHSYEIQGLPWSWRNESSPPALLTIFVTSNVHED